MKKNKKNSDENQETLDHILESIKALVYKLTYNENAEITSIDYVSSNVNSIYKISSTEFLDRLKKGKIKELIHEDNKLNRLKDFNNALKSEKETTLKYKLVNGDWILEKIHSKKTSNGENRVFGIVQNITEEVLKQEETAITENKYKELFSRNLAGVYRTHVDGYILDCNQVFCDILGYTKTEILQNRSIQELYYYAEDRASYIAELRKNKFLTKFLTILKRKDGRKLIVNNNVGIYPDKNGELNIIEGTLVDVTQEYETNISLQQSELKYKLLFDSTNISILLLTFLEGEFYILQANSNAKSFFKTTQINELKGIKLSTLFVKKPNFENIFKELMDYDKIQKEFDILDLKNNQLNVDLFFSHVHIENEQIIQLVIQDNSLKRKNRIDLENSQRNFKNIVETSPAGIFIFSEENLMYSNKIAKEILKKQLKTSSKKQREIFSEEHYNIIKNLSKNSQNQPYIEIDIENTHRYSIKLVKLTYNEKPVILVSLTDVTLQYQFNTQKLRAEIAEETNYELEKEIEHHKKTQKKLVEKSSRLNAFIESSANLFIATLDKKYRLTSMNKNFNNEFNKYSKTPVKEGANLLDIINAEENRKRWFEKKLFNTFNKKDQVVITQFPSLNGKERWLEIFLNPILIGEKLPTEISLIAHDISEKIESERRIAASESRHKALLQAIPDLIFRINKNGVFTDFRINNKEDSKLFFEYTNTKEIIGKKVQDIFTEKDQAKKFMAYVYKAIKADELITHYYKVEEPRNKRKRYYENRYSKISEDEVLVIARNITEQEENEIRLRDSLKEKEILLKEVHHRVKNNLQVINSILNLQTSYIDDPKTLEVINESQNRIRSMSYIHESLYQTENFSSINFRDYITNLVHNLFQSYQTQGEKIKLKLNVTESNLLLDQAIPCGLILNELLSNALKYAFPNDTSGEIAINLTEKTEKRIHLEVNDNGIGLGENFDLKKQESLGLNLVEVLVDQLDGTLKFESRKGTKILIIFEKAEV